MSSKIEQLIDEIEEYIDGCKYQALSNTKIIVNKEEIDALLGSGRADFVILDEITHAVRYGLVDVERLRHILMHGKKETAGDTLREITEAAVEKNCEIILTGRETSEELLAYSDYISEIRCVRHPFQRGVAARPGIEY